MDETIQSVENRWGWGREGLIRPHQDNSSLMYPQKENDF